GSARTIGSRWIAALVVVASASARVDVVGDVVGALVEVDDAVVRVRVLREGALAIVETLLGRPTEEVGARRTVAGRNRRREVVPGRVADLVLAVVAGDRRIAGRDLPGRSMELDA